METNKHVGNNEKQGSSETISNPKSTSNADACSTSAESYGSRRLRVVGTGNEIHGMYNLNNSDI